MLPRFGYLRAATPDQAVQALGDYGGAALILAGGTDLLVSMKEGTANPRYLVDIKAIPELHRIEGDGAGGLKIGACVTVNELLEFRALPAGMAALRDAARGLGTNQVRNRATVGGNLCNASPACDLGPALLVLGARLRVVSTDGERVIALKDFFACPKQTCLLKHELVTEILISPAAGTLSSFAKRTRLRGHDLAVVNAAAALGADGKLAMALGAVGPKPLLLEGLAGLGLEDEAEITKAILGSIAPIDDVRASAAYRTSMTRVLVGEVLNTIANAKAQ